MQTRTLRHVRPIRILIDWTRFWSQWNVFGRACTRAAPLTRQLFEPPRLGDSWPVTHPGATSPPAVGRIHAVHGFLRIMFRLIVPVAGRKDGQDQLENLSIVEMLACLMNHFVWDGPVRFRSQRIGEGQGCLLSLVKEGARYPRLDFLYPLTGFAMLSQGFCVVVRAQRALVNLRHAQADQIQQGRVHGYFIERRIFGVKRADLTTGLHGARKVAIHGASFDPKGGAGMQPPGLQKCRFEIAPARNSSCRTQAGVTALPGGETGTMAVL